MRLLQRKDDGTLVLVSVADNHPPPFAILSHTWGGDEDEIVYHDVAHHRGGSPADYEAQAKLRSRHGYKKVDFCLRQAARDGLQNVWIDTCCINKDNQQELNKAINWMFRWYAKADRCYVFLSDVAKGTIEQGITTVSPDITKGTREQSVNTVSSDWRTAFAASRWFTRGWTVQELLAPLNVEFFSRDGETLGDKVYHEYTYSSASRGRLTYVWHI
jgi:hypothetical protein